MVRKNSGSQEEIGKEQNIFTTWDISGIRKEEIDSFDTSDVKRSFFAL